MMLKNRLCTILHADILQISIALYSELILISGHMYSLIGVDGHILNWYLMLFWLIKLNWYRFIWHFILHTHLV